MRRAILRLGEKIRDKPWLEFALVSAFFSTIFLVNLAASGFDPATHFIGKGNEFIDWNAHFWSTWHFHQSLLGNDGFFHSSLEFYPHGVDTLTMHGTIVESLLGGIFALLLGMDGALLGMAAFTLLGNALGGYWLVRKMTGGVVPGLVTGLTLSMNGLVAWSLNTGNLDHGIWLWHCLFILYFIRMLEGSGWKDAVIASVFAWLAMLTNFFHIILLALFGLVLLLCRLRRLEMPQWKSLALFMALTFTLLSPLLYSFVSESRTRGNTQTRGRADIARDGAFSETEGPQSPFSGPARITRITVDDSVAAVEYLPWVNSDHGKNQTYFFLWLLVLLAIAIEPRRTWPWVVAGTTFFLLALGPSLKGGPSSGYAEGYPGVPMPYLFLYKYVPFFYRIQFPSRIFAYSLLAFGLAGGLGTLGAMRLLRGRRAWVRNGVLAVLLLGASVEMSARWDLVLTRKPHVNPFYTQLSKMPERFAIIEVPFNFNMVDAKYLHMQARHGKALFNGVYPPYLSDDPTGGLVRDNIFLQWILHEQQGFFGRIPELMPPTCQDAFRRWFDHPPPTQAMLDKGLEAGRRDLVDIGFRYLLLHKEVHSQTRAYRWYSDALLRALERHLGEPVYDDREIVAFDLRRSPPQSRRE